MPDKNCVRVTMNQQDTDLTFEQLGLQTDAEGKVLETVSDDQVLNAVRGIVGEQVRDQGGQFTFAVRRALNTGMVYVYPKPGFGRAAAPEEIKVFFIDSSRESDINTGLTNRDRTAKDVVGITWNPDLEKYAVFYKD